MDGGSCVRIEVETEIEVIGGFAAGQLNLNLATRSPPPFGRMGKELKSTSIAHLPLHKTTPLPAGREI